jgi:GTPase SAR1 family protein
MRQLDISDTQVSDLSPLAGLEPLERLLAPGTQVSDLSPLKGLWRLRELDLSATQVSDLAPLLRHIGRGIPVKWEEFEFGSEGICLAGCLLTSPPPEIVKQGYEAMLNYFEERAAGAVDHLYEAKLLILGEGRAGKTSLLRRLYQPDKPLPQEDETTRGIAIYRHEFKLTNGRTFRLNVWDFGGQQIYHATHQFFLTHRSLYVLVDDTCKDAKAVTDEGFKYWLELIDVFSGHSPTLIFQNEKGGRSKQIDLSGIRKSFDNVKEVYKGNLEQQDAADNLREAISLFASQLSHIGEEVPARWVKVREDIEELAGNKPHVSLEEYFDIYRRHIKFDEARALLLSRYLHDLGVFLHFQDDSLLVRRIILQNEWVTEAVFRILDDEAVKKNLGRFDLDDCRRLWRGPLYARMHPELLSLMQKFELCYELWDCTPKAFLAPQLLPAERPASAGSGKPDDLVLRYRYEFLPKGMISRLTVRQHRFVRNPEEAWISGVLFERGSSSVLAEILTTGEIELRGRGPDRKALLSVIAADLDTLNDSFQGLRGKVDKRIPCNCNRCITITEPEFFEEKTLLYRREHGRLKVECPKSFEEVYVQELLDGIKMQKPPEWATEAAPSRSLRKLRVFLASSSELQADRDEFVRYFREQNDSLIKHGVYLILVSWARFLDAMSETRLQDEYNKAIRDCDVFVSLFFTKAGKYTQEEFDVAYGQFKNSQKPLVYTFFKDAEIKLSSTRKEDLKSLWEFQEKLGQLGHFYTPYENIEDLKLKFRGQLDEILAKLQA